MIRTNLCDLLGIDDPVLLGGLGGGAAEAEDILATRLPALVTKEPRLNKACRR